MHLSFHAASIAQLHLKLVLGDSHSDFDCEKKDFIQATRVALIEDEN